MALFLNDAVLDAALQLIIDNVDSMSLCEGFAVTAAANALTSFTTDGNGTTGELAVQAMIPGDFTLQDNGSTGREIAVDAKAGVAVNANGVGDNVILWDAASNVVYAHTGLATDRTVTTSDTVTFNTWDIQINDPV